MPNKLIKEQSPYLLQHAHNPVDWYPWGDEAFKRAEKENKPVLVSIGYAACHWCHVMEHESFEDDATAAYMNEHFINIKVDREEHPDVDHMYMDAVQAITGSGGWPLNVFVSHDRMPFYGGTYYPPKPMYNRPSWSQVLENIHQVWTEKPEDIHQQTKQMSGYLQQLSEVAVQSNEKWGTGDADKAADNLLAYADKTYGGFGKAPKFPATMSIRYLLEHFHYTGKESSLTHAIKSLDALIEGGIYDQLGGGLARYSTDDYWLAPHFEKMLYDNALLITTLCDAYTITKKNEYKNAIEQTLSFINRELLNTEGGFYSALDADSESVEGKFYTWTWDEWQDVIGDNKLVTSYYGVQKAGNWEGTNILHKALAIDELAAKNNLSIAELAKHIDDANKLLLAKRQDRTRPLTDDKSLLSWNALMNTALCKAGVALDKRDYLQQASAHAQWMIDTYFVKGVWMHTYKNKVARITAKLDDLAYLIEALLQLASATQDNQWLAYANDITEVVQKDFLHDNKSFYYFSSIKQKDIPVRKTDLYDNALPSANSIMADNLIWLGILKGDYSQIEQGTFMLHKMRSVIMRYTSSFANWALYAQRYLHKYRVAIISGKDYKGLHLGLLQFYIPHTLIIAANEGDKTFTGIDKKSPEKAAYVYVCDTEKCMPPVNDLENVKKMLK